MLLIKTFIEFIKIGSFSFGGGLATLPNIYKMVEATNWCTVSDVTNMITVSQMTPGPLACNIAAYIGCKQGGIIMGIIATIAFIIPAIIYMGIVCKFLEEFKTSQRIQQILKMLRAYSIALIISSSMIMFKIAFLNNQDETLKLNNLLSSINYKSIILAIILVIIVKKYKTSTIKNIIISAIAGFIFRF